MADLINIKFPDGKSTKIEKGLIGFDIAKQISISLSKTAIAFKVNGKILDLSRTIVFKPKRLAYKAADVPDGPAPTIIISYVLSIA